MLLAHRQRPSRAFLAGCCVVVAGCAARLSGETPLPPPAVPARGYYTAELIDFPDWGESGRGPTDAAVAPSNWISAAGSDEQITAGFRGTGRTAAKTSVPDLETEPVRAIDRLVATFVNDATMLARRPPITNAPNSGRAHEEYRSVKVRAWIYAIKYEADHDWHLIVGTDPHEGVPTFLSCEVSGLPPKSADSYPQLLKARQAFARIFGNDLPGPGGYIKYTTPIPVEIEGMLFFDLDHPPGTVGPTGMRPKTAWEIRPVTKIELGSS